MSFAITHFAVGAAIATLVLGVVAPRSRFKGTAIVASGIWAMIPDVEKIAPTYADRFDVVYDLLSTDLFWFHGTLDVLDPSDSALIAAAAVGLWLLVTLFVEISGFLRAALAERSTRRTEHGLGPGD
jgi:hypothetical protein